MSAAASATCSWKPSRTTISLQVALRCLLAGAERREEVASMLGRFEPAILSREAQYDRFLVDGATGRSRRCLWAIHPLDFESPIMLTASSRSTSSRIETRFRLVFAWATEALGEGRSLEASPTRSRRELPMLPMCTDSRRGDPVRQRAGRVRPTSSTHFYRRARQEDGSTPDEALHSRSPAAGA